MVNKVLCVQGKLSDAQIGV